MFSRACVAIVMLIALFTAGCGGSGGNDTTGSGTLTIKSVSPSNGPLAGGTQVTITGTGFDGTIAVKFGTKDATVASHTSTSLVVTSPGTSVAGTVDIIVTATGTGSASFVRGFTYDQSVAGTPTVTQVSPASGPLAGGQAVTISGTNFQSDAIVTFGTREATGVKVQGTTTILCDTPAASTAGAVNVKVDSTINGSATLSLGYTYTAPVTITQISPGSGPVSGSISVTITGTNFQLAGGAAPTVTFGGLAATNVVVNGTFDQIVCTAPAHAAGQVDVTVTTASNGTNTFVKGFRYTELVATPRQSSTIAIAEATNVLYVCNPENDTVTLMDASVTNSPTALVDVPVGGEPRSVAVLASGAKAYVANARSGTVSVIVPPGRVSTTLAVGVEPRAVMLSPNGTKCYVANAVSNTLSIIDTATDTVSTTVSLAAFTGAGATQPRALAMTNDGDFDDTDETLYVAMFFAERRTGKTWRDEGQDDERRGVVIATAADGSNPTAITLDPIVPAAYGLSLGGPDGTGFTSNGSALASVATVDGAGGQSALTGQAPANPPAATFQTGCFPNQLAALAIQPGGLRKCYVVSTGASPNGPTNFDVNVQGMVSTINVTNSEQRTTVDSTGKGSAPLNMNRGVGAATVIANSALKLFYSVPTAIAWKPDGTEAWIAIETADLVVKMTIDGGGTPTVVNAGGATGVTHVDLQKAGIPGKAPFGLCFNAAGTRLYVNNFVTRAVTVVDTANHVVLGSAQAGQPAPQGDQVQKGAELFFSGRGPTRPGSAASGAMSNNAWGACVGCHPDGRTDNVTWMFDAGPRQTIPLDGMFSKRTLHDQRVLNWSAVRDENQDFELNTRAVSGGRGLIVDDRQVIIVGGADSNGVARSTLSATLTPSPTAGATFTIGTNNAITNQALPALNQARFNFGMATDRAGTIYVCEGQKGPLNSDYLSDLEIYVPGSTAPVKQIAGAFPASKHKHGAAAVQTALGTRVYVFGGYDAAGNLDGTVYEFNPVTNVVRTVQSMPFPLAEFATVVVPATNANNVTDTIHVICGNNANEGATQNVTSAVWVFQPDPVGQGAWVNGTLSAPLTGRRRLMAAAVFQPGRNKVAKQSVYVFGGRDNGNVILNTVEEYQVNSTTSFTTNITLTPIPVGLTASGVGVSGGNVYLVGGEDGTTGQATAAVWQFQPSRNPSNSAMGPVDAPAGSWDSQRLIPEPVFNLTIAVTGTAVSVPPPVANLTPVGNTFRDVDQDSIAQWIEAKVHAQVAPLSGTTNAATVTAIANGRSFFGTFDLSGGSNITCATCHGGPKWTRSRVDYLAPPSTNVTLGAQQVTGVQLVFTQSQPPGSPLAGLGNEGVLLNVGTFEINGQPLPGGTARINETRINPADSRSRIGALGGGAAPGFNIPSLLSVGSTAPYFYNGLAQTLLEVIDGSHDGIGSGALITIHRVPAGNRSDVIQFLQSIDETTNPFP